MVAEQGKYQDLDILVNDKEWAVRLEVAKQGRDKDLDILVNDKDVFVLNVLMKHRRSEDIERIKARIKNGDFNDIQFEIEKMILNGIKNIIKEYENM